MIAFPAPGTFRLKGEAASPLAGFPGLARHGLPCSVATSPGLAPWVFEVPIAFMSKEKDLPLLFNIFLLVMVFFLLSLIVEFRLARRLWVVGLVICGVLYP